MRTSVRVMAGLVCALALGAATAGAAGAAEREVFVPGAVEHGDGTVTLPLLRGTSRGRTVHFVVLDASRAEAATRFRAARVPKLGNARPGAVQQGRWVNGVLDVPAAVDFTPRHRVEPGPTGFPPAVADPGAVGEPGYSPLVRLPDGTVLDAPQVAGPSGRADKVVAIDTVRGTVRLRETDGFARGRPVRYVSTDSSDRAAAALEESTWAPALRAAPRPGDDSTASARATLVAFVNGRTGAADPQRQGLNSALLDGLSPLNVLAWLPNQGRYSPLWDVHPARWSDAAVSAGRDVRQTAVDDVTDLARGGAVTAPGGGPLAPADVVVVCPIISAG